MSVICRRTGSATIWGWKVTTTQNGSKNTNSKLQTLDRIMGEGILLFRGSPDSYFWWQMGFPNSCGRMARTLKVFHSQQLLDPCLVILKYFYPVYLAIDIFIRGGLGERFIFTTYNFPLKTCFVCTLQVLHKAGRIKCLTPTAARTEMLQMLLRFCTSSWLIQDPIIGIFQL